MAQGQREWYKTEFMRHHLPRFKWLKLINKQAKFWKFFHQLKKLVVNVDQQVILMKPHMENENQRVDFIGK